MVGGEKMGQDKKPVPKRICMKHAMGDKEKQKGKSDGRHDNGNKKRDCGGVGGKEDRERGNN